MLTHRRWQSLDSADHGWLLSKHHFQVSSTGNAAHRALGCLVVWNDDEIDVGAGFPLHGHRDIEIITYVCQGLLGHRDTLGSEGLVSEGDVQVMSAGRGIRHTEFNKGQLPLRIYQIWLLPREGGGTPQWGSKPFPKSSRCGHFVALASGYDADAEALPIRANARLLGATLAAGERIQQVLTPLHQAYLVMASGRVKVDGEQIGPLDGVAISNASHIEVLALEASELVMVEAR